MMKKFKQMNKFFLNQSMKWGLFSDIHFQQKDLKRIVKTSEWIYETFKKEKVSNIICLGDIIHNRENVHVPSLSNCLKFLKDLSEICPLHVILGNHDFNLKNDIKYSSLDLLEIFSKNIQLYKEYSRIKIENLSCQMVPWMSKPNEEYLNDIVFGHLEYNGAKKTIQNICRNQNQVPNFKRIFSGHFHHFHHLKNQNGIENMTYIGSPLQFNFRDSNDPKGIVIYHPLKDEIEFITNPDYDHFKVIYLKKDEKIEYEKYQDKKVQIIYENENFIEYQNIQSEFLKQGIQSIEKIQKKEYLNYEEYFNSIPKEYQNFGYELLNKLNLNQKSKSSFIGNIKFIFIQNFLGFQDEIKIDFNDFEKINFISGENGSGKSSIFESISWCLFDKFLRSDMKINWAINDQIKKDCKVKIEFENGYSIERYRGMNQKNNGVNVYFKNELLNEYQKSHIKTTQSMINELIGIDFEIFRNSIIPNQFSNFKIIEKILGFEEINFVLEEIRSEIKNLKSEKKIIDYMNQQTCNNCNSSLDFQFSSNNRLNLLIFWEKQLKFDFKTYLLKDAIEQFNSILNHFHQFIPFFQLKLSLDEELNIIQDFGKRSTGQRRRNEIILIISLFHLIQQRLGFKSNFIMLDEVLNSLDQNGIDEILNLLENVNIEKIFIISHQFPSYQNYKLINVKMTQNGTKIEY